MPSPVLHHVEWSPPCQIVRIVADALGVDLELRNVDLQNQEQLSDAFIKINPQHTVPTFVDDDFVLWESRAIITYLANEYAKNSPLYPTEAKKRALVDLRLAFDFGTLYTRTAETYFPHLFEGEPMIEAAKVDRVREALQLLDQFLGKTKYVAGDELTLADYSIAVSVTLLGPLGLKWDLSAFPNVSRWYLQCQKDIRAWEKIVKPNVAALEAFCKTLNIDLDVIKNLNAESLKAAKK